MGCVYSIVMGSTTITVTTDDVMDIVRGYYPTNEGWGDYLSILNDVWWVMDEWGLDSTDPELKEIGREVAKQIDQEVNESE